jgi:hypothetical protein
MADGNLIEGERVADEPVEWPGGAPDRCHWSDVWGSWQCSGAPPAPWPQEPPAGYSHALFGPPGTQWFMWEDEYNEAIGNASEGVLRWMLRKLRPWTSPQGAGGYIWTAPDPLAEPADPVEDPPMPMTWIRTAINATIGTDEQVVHVLNWRHSTQENAPVDAATLKTVGDAVRDAWTDMWDEAVGGTGVFSGKFPTSLVYREVRSSLLVQEAPAAKPNWPLPTAVSPFGNGMAGTGVATPLPYEVACGVSFNTNWRGTSRFRGRLYLGPLTVSVMGADGQFNPVQTDGLGTLIGTKVVAAVEAATDYELHIVSQKFGTSAKVTGIRMGETPDSQRRRRRNRPESYQQVWGSPVGAL